MSILKSSFVVIGVLFLGALGALLFNFFALPYMVASLYFDRFQFVKDYKEGKIVVTQKEQIYIQETSAIENAIVKAQKSIVAIQNSTLAVKSGFIATSDGLIITLPSAVAAPSAAKVFLRGQQSDFTVEKMDIKNNLALLKVNKNNLQTVGFADPGRMKLGQKIFLVAPTSVGGENWLANEGIITEITEDVIRTNITEKLVANGSPMLNAAGQLVGLNVVDASGRVLV